LPVDIAVDAGLTAGTSGEIIEDQEVVGARVRAERDQAGAGLRTPAQKKVASRVRPRRYFFRHPDT